MHELGIVIQIVKQMEDFMDENNIRRIDTLVLQVGELSGVVPKYLEDVYPIAVEKSRLEDTNLELEITPGIGQCEGCNFNYNLVENDNLCPRCGSANFRIITGKEFMIHRIHAE
ncbi:MAG: hydrogenase maturation nickel metallochaperone HypA [Spirochaetia bacterium]|nr:hydrogenase maturation nickel metallochaperone HypA [Spirochaetia bacterium]